MASVCPQSNSRTAAAALLTFSNLTVWNYTYTHTHTHARSPCLVRNHHKFIMSAWRGPHSLLVLHKESLKYHSSMYFLLYMNNCLDNTPYLDITFRTAWCKGHIKGHKHRCVRVWGKTVLVWSQGQLGTSHKVWSNVRRREHKLSTAAGHFCSCGQITQKKKYGGSLIVRTFL